MVLYIKEVNQGGKKMTRIGPTNFSDGNKTYQFVTYGLEGPIYNAPGLYIFSKGERNAQGEINHDILYIGQTDSFRSRLNPGHEKWNNAIDSGMNYISVYVPTPIESRIDIEQRLIDYNQPPLNDQLIQE